MSGKESMYKMFGILTQLTTQAIRVLISWEQGRHFDQIAKKTLKFTLCLEKYPRCFQL